MPLGIYNSAAFLTASGVAVAPNADVEVRRESDSGLASIFSDRAGASAITQPGFQADANGRFEFYAAGLSGGYQVKVTKGAETQTVRYQAVGTAKELDADPFWATVWAAATAAAARLALGFAAIAAKGDLWIGTAADTIGKLAVGANGLTIIADSAQTNGVRWGEFALPQNYYDGCRLSNNATDPAKDIDISAGARRDASNVANMVLPSTLTKQIDAAWNVGTNAGGMDTGSAAENQWYYKWLIRRSDTGVVDALFSLSATAPTMPANYDQKRRIGVVRTDGSINILPFYQALQMFFYRTPPSILSGGTATTETAVTTSSAVPPEALKFLLRMTTVFSYGNVINAQNFTTIRVFTGVFFAQQGGYQTGNTGNFNEENQIAVPHTGNLYYLQASGSVTSASSSLGIAGFEFPL